MTILDKIVQETKETVKRRKSQLSLNEIRRQAEGMTKRGSRFYHALNQPGTNIIAEIKKASPSKGVICKKFDPIIIADEYQKGGASAISILTDEPFFKGKLSYLDDIAGFVDVPLLRKDFFIDEYQLYEAKVHGADAVLLLAALLDENALNDFITVTHNIAMNALVEVHNQIELQQVLQSRARIIGVNNRDLRTFQVSLQTSIDLAAEIPGEILKVSESGINDIKDIRRLQKVGYRAFLIGESLMRQKDRIGTLRSLRGV